MNTIERLWEHAKDLRDDRRALEKYRRELIGSHVYAVILSEERRMVALALNAERAQQEPV
jgi:hypothetical protein